MPIVISGGNVSSSSSASKRIFVASRSYYPEEGPYTTSGTALSFTYRLQHKILVPCFDVSFAYGNFGNGANNPITVTASLEDSSGNIYPLSFGGQDSITLNVNDYVVSDPIAVSFNQGDTIWSRSCVSVSTAGYVWPIGAISTISGEGMTSGDITRSGSPTTSNSKCFTPMAVVGSTATAYPSVLLVGDSIMCGYNTNPLISGYEQALINANIPYGKVSKGGELASDFSSASTNYLRMKLAQYATHAIVEYGSNDLYSAKTLSAIQTSLQSLWTTLSNRGLKVFQTTITPRTNSSDSYATLANQTAYNADFGGTNSGTSLGTCVRTQLNDWIRTTPSPLTGYFEVSDTVESSRNSGLWRVDQNVINGGGGVHPNQTGQNLMQAAINTSLIHL